MRSCLPFTSKRLHLGIATSLIVLLLLLLAVDQISPSVSQAKALANSSSSLDTGLVGYWKMDEGSWVGDCNTKSVLDSSGNNNHAKACPNGSAPQPGPGKFGNAAILDGSNDYLQVSNNPSLYGFSAMSVSAWVFLDPSALPQAPKIVGKANGFGGGYRLEVLDTGKLRWLLVANGSETWMVSTDNLPTGRWVLVTGVYDGSNMNLYIDGALAAPAQPKTGIVTDSGTDLYFGTYENNVGTALWKGYLDEIRIYNRALSADEVLQLYSPGGDLVGYWKMDESTWINDCSTPSVIDSSFFGNHGKACPNGTGPTGGASGRIGKAGSFDGVDDYISIPYTASLAFSATQTIAAWVKFNSVSLSEQVIFGQGTNDGGASGFELELGNVLCGGSSAKVCLNMDAGPAPLQSTTPLTVGTWYYIAATWDSSNWKIYINGALDASKPSSYVPVANTHTRVLGARQTEMSSQGYLYGSADDVRLYDRALSAGEVLQLYNSGADLVGYWKMDENSWVGDCNTKSVHDSSGHNNDAKACPNGSAPQPGPGLKGNAAVLDGLNDYLQVSNNPSLYGFSAMSLSAWVFLDPSALPQAPKIVGKSNGFSGGYRLEVLDTGKLRWLVGADGGESWIVSTNNLPTAQWVLVTGVYDGSNMNLYINGASAAPTQAKSGSVRDSGTDLYFGTYENNVGTLLWKGYLDEIRIYNRTLSADEIMQLYNESAPAKLYLPLIRNVPPVDCTNFFDDFSNPQSGWPVGDTGSALREYRAGEYRILARQAGLFFLSKSPACDQTNYYVDVDTRWVSTTGNSYGLIFGVISGFNQYYLFDLNTDVQQYRLLRRNAGGGFTTITGPTPSSAIHAGLATNHLQARRLGSGISLYVNGTWLGDWTDGAITGQTGTGVVASAYTLSPTADARFDNFAVRPPALMQSQTGSIPSSATGNETNSVEIPNETVPPWTGR